MLNQTRISAGYVIIVIAIVVSSLFQQTLASTTTPQAGEGNAKATRIAAEKPAHKPQQSQDIPVQKYLRKYTGTWQHKVPSVNDTEKTLVLRGDIDQQGNLKFKFLQQHFSYLPVFEKCTVHKDRIEIDFKLVTYYDASSTEHTIKYILSRNKKILRGQFVQSWKDPMKVSLKPLNHTQSLEMLGNFADKINRTRSESTELKNSHKRKIREYESRIKSLQKDLAQSKTLAIQLQQQIELLRKAMIQVKEKTAELIDQLLISQQKPKSR